MTTTPSTTHNHLSRGDGKGLAAGTLGLWGSTVIGLASTAPVYSLVATLGWVVLAVGAQAPIAFIVAFIPMLFIAFAYRELNRENPDCGTTFTWGTKAVGPWVGWMGGWGVAVAGMVVLANLAQIASIYFWALLGQEFANNDWRVILVAVAFIAAMTWVSWRGVEIGECRIPLRAPRTRQACPCQNQRTPSASRTSCSPFNMPPSASSWSPLSCSTSAARLPAPRPSTGSG